LFTRLSLASDDPPGSLIRQAVADQSLSIDRAAYRSFGNGARGTLIISRRLSHRARVDAQIGAAAAKIDCVGRVTRQALALHAINVVCHPLLSVIG